jgi:hypothetical protein
LGIDDKTTVKFHLTSVRTSALQSLNQHKPSEWKQFDVAPNMKLVAKMYFSSGDSAVSESQAEDADGPHSYGGAVSRSASQPSEVSQMLAAVTTLGQELRNELKAQSSRIDKLTGSGKNTQKARKASGNLNAAFQPYAQLWNMSGPPDEEEEEDEDDEDPFGFNVAQHQGSSSTSRPAAASGSQVPSTVAPPVDVNSLVQLELLKMLQKRSKQKDDDSSDDDDIPASAKGVAGFKGLQSYHRRLRRNSHNSLKKYRVFVKSKIGVANEKQVWRYSDHSKEIRNSFGKMKGLWRCHFLLNEIIQALDDGDSNEAAMLAIQSAKALHQVALDKGDWSNALLMIPLSDPIGRADFGGEEEELVHVHGYRKALSDLKSKVKAEIEEETEEKPPKGGRKP